MAVLENSLLGSCLKSVCLCRDQGLHFQPLMLLLYMLWVVQSPLKGSCPPVLIPAFNSPSLPPVASAKTELGSHGKPSPQPTASPYGLHVHVKEPPVGNIPVPCFPKKILIIYYLPIYHFLRFPQAEPLLKTPMHLYPSPTQEKKGGCL